jgi:hypothetical protein
MIDLEKLKARARECQNLTDGLWLSKAADEIEYMRSVFAKSHEVAPAVDAQPVACARIYADNTCGLSWIAPAYSMLPVGEHNLYTAAQSEGLRKDAEELLRRIPTTPEQMIDFIGSHFDSMEAQEWSEFSGDARAKPSGDLSMVRYSLTVHDLLSAFDWADLSEYAIDAALSQHTGEKDD